MKRLYPRSSLERKPQTNVEKLPLPAPTAWYAIPLRLIVGFGFMQHGYAKLARGPEDFINVLHAIGVPAAYLLGWATIIVEIIGGFLMCSSIPPTLSSICTTPVAGLSSATGTCLFPHRPIPELLH